MNHNQVPIGITILIVSGVPFLNFLTIPISFFYYGIKGNDIAIASRPFLDDVQFIAVQNAWRNWALSIHLGTYALIVLFVIFAAVLGANTPATKN